MEKSEKKVFIDRKKRRENVMFLLYQMDIRKDYNIYERDIENFDDYQLKLINLWNDNKEEVDSKISSNLKAWSLQTLGKIELATIRLSVVEILYMDEIPNTVSVNEAIELIKKYCDEKSYSFVNGVLKAFV